MSGYGVSNTISTRTADGGWRVELVLDSDYERDLLDGETFVGLGANESEAGLQASRAYLSAATRVGRRRDREWISDELFQLLDAFEHDLGQPSSEGAKKGRGRVTAWRS